MKVVSWKRRNADYERLHLFRDHTVCFSLRQRSLENDLEIAKVGFHEPECRAASSKRDFEFR